MSRKPSKLNPDADRTVRLSLHETSVTRAAFENFGDGAPTAVAFCGLHAWFEGRDAEVQQWTRIFNRLKN